jgi:hypothetical protein
MPVLAAIAHLHADPTLRLRALAGLARLPGLMLGQRVESRLPIVLSTDTRGADKALWRSIQDTAGVAHVELVSADFSDIVQPPGELT